jgi:hypothetical protein
MIAPRLVDNFALRDRTSVTKSSPELHYLGQLHQLPALSLPRMRESKKRGSKKPDFTKMS